MEVPGINGRYYYHWHNDMPGLTAASQVLAYSQGCPRQIVRYGKRVYGFQCHLEITLEGIQTLIQAVPDDLKPSLFTQTEKELLAQDYASINQNMMQLLDRFVKVCISTTIEVIPSPVTGEGGPQGRMRVE